MVERVSSFPLARWLSYALLRGTACISSQFVTVANQDVNNAYTREKEEEGYRSPYAKLSQLRYVQFGLLYDPWS